MAESPAVPFVCQLDFARRSSVPVRRRTVQLASHLSSHPSLPLADVLLADVAAGRPLANHLSPMKNQRNIFKRAHRKGTWTDYRRYMDHLFNSGASATFIAVAAHCWCSCTYAKAPA